MITDAQVEQGHEVGDNRGLRLRNEDNHSLMFKAGWDWAELEAKGNLHKYRAGKNPKTGFSGAKVS